ncbi:MAG: 30S ribosomal protein S3 [Candidatus Gracilibacteria bacterium]|jgi:small subunit ribosomal protein S3|nr:30S ribosomal protein S3 [Candidatus Gracilibacteria bacterium]
MGQKVNPNGIRLGITRDWTSKWFAPTKNFAKLFHQDLELEKVIRKELNAEGISTIEILRAQGKIIVDIHTAKPGLIIGRGGETIEKLKDTLKKKYNENFTINIKEIKKPMLDATVVAELIKLQIEKRISYRRAAKLALEKVIESGALGCKIYVGGRLNGVEISRSEFFSKGKIPLQTFRADIDYCSTHAMMSYGKIGVKVWIYRGDVFKKDLEMRLKQHIEEIKQ